MRVELTVSGFADLTATATYGTYIAAETGIEPISSESDVPYRLQRYASLPSEDLVLLHRTHPHSVRINDYFVIIDLDVIPLHYSAKADANGFEPLLIVLETIVLPVTPSIYSGCGEIRTHDLRFKRPLLCLLSYTSI